VEENRASSLVRSQTPPSCGVDFAILFASFDKVFVGPMPTQVGMPVHIETVERRSRAHSSRRSGSIGVASRNDSSIE
jgi:hypothetical protein